jgi:hypothetical protein
MPDISSTGRTRRGKGLARIAFRELFPDDRHQIPLLETVIDGHAGGQDFRQMPAERIDLLKFRVSLAEARCSREPIADVVDQASREAFGYWMIHGREAVRFTDLSEK